MYSKSNFLTPAAVTPVAVTGKVKRRRSRGRKLFKRGRKGRRKGPKRGRKSRSKKTKKT